MGDLKTEEYGGEFLRIKTVYCNFRKLQLFKLNNKVVGN